MTARVESKPYDEDMWDYENQSMLDEEPDFDEGDSDYEEDED